MAGHNRHITWETDEIRAPIRGQTVVEVGDLMFISKSFGAGVRNGSAADNYAYPFDAANTASSSMERLSTVHVDFLGVALQGSQSGITEDITVATAGVFRYPLQRGRGGVTTSNVTIGMVVSAASPVGTNGPENQQVRPGSATAGSTAYLGYCVKTESGTSFVDFVIKTAYSGGTIIPQ